MSISDLRAIYVPRFGPSRTNGEKPTEYLIELPNSPTTQSDQSHKTMEIKFKKCSRHKPIDTTLKKSETLKRQMPQHLKMTMSAVSQRLLTAASHPRKTGCHIDGGENSDVFTFSQKDKHGKSTNEMQSKVAVIKSISKMLQENRCIRERLVSLSQGPTATAL